MGGCQREAAGPGGWRALVGAGPRSRADRGAAGQAGVIGSVLANHGQTDARRCRREFHRLDARAISRRGGRPSERTGIDFIDPDELGAHVTALDAAGFQCHFHAIGDRAVRSALDAVAAARRANGWNDLRHHVAHIQVIHPDDLARFRRLGVTANAQPLWAQHEEYQRDLTIPYLGEPRWRWQYPFASLIRNGAQLAIGSDWSVSSADPWKILEVAVRRIDPENRGADPFLPDERLDLPAALDRRHRRVGVGQPSRPGDGDDRAGEARRPGRGRP